MSCLTTTSQPRPLRKQQSPSRRGGRGERCRCLFCLNACSLSWSQGRAWSSWSLAGEVILAQQQQHRVVSHPRNAAHLLGDLGLGRAAFPRRSSSASGPTVGVACSVWTSIGYLAVYLPSSITHVREFEPRGAARATVLEPNRSCLCLLSSSSHTKPVSWRRDSCQLMQNRSPCEPG